MSAPFKENSPLYIELFDNLEESIYQLAALDKEDVNLAWSNLKESSYFGPNILKGAIHKLFSQVFAYQSTFLKEKEDSQEFYKSSYNKLINSYAKGLGIRAKDALYLNFMHEYLNNPSAIFEGIKDHHLESNSPIELINTPIQETFNDKLRFVHFKSPENLEAIVIQNLMSPFATYGGVNESGLSVQLVQRDALKINYHGMSASFLALVILLGFNDIVEIEKFLKGQQLVFHWEFHVKDSLGNYKIIAIDGREVEIRDGQSRDTKEAFKYHLEIYKKKHWPTTVSALTIGSNDIFLSLIDSKNFEIKQIHYSDLFQSRPSVTKKTPRLSKSIKEIFTIKNYLNHAQVAFNSNNSEDCYHQIQLAIVFAKKMAGNQKPLIAKLELVFMACQYIFESHRETQQYIHQNLIKLYPGLGPYHKDLALILMQRLQILMNEEINLLEGPKELKRVVFTESKLGKLAHQALKKTTLLRPNHLDFCPTSGL
ncbi:hypothetical protein ABMA77_13875 [Halobacteriovorax sp. RZ-1]|uniref:hypothetical protein n=1 Tax=unclassified Halobacteriovorax TaxID=2639665 RepID=UPI00371146D4